MKKADFHVHTNYSDGVFSPEKIVDTALEAGLEAIALTDHDNILSYAVAQNYLQSIGKEDQLEIIQGKLILYIKITKFIFWGIL